MPKQRQPALLFDMTFSYVIKNVDLLCLREKVGERGQNLKDIR